MEVEPDPGPIPGRFKSWAQLRAWASHRFPRATLVTEGLDLKAWNRITPILDGLATDWPGVANELGWITTRHPFWEDNSQGAVAAADSLFGEKIAFNPDYFRMPSRLAKSIARGEEIGLYPEGAKDVRELYFVNHEWGHLVHAWLRRHHRERWRDLMARFAVDPEALQSPFDEDKATEISQYAKRGIVDAFAEAFSVIEWRSQGHWPEIIRRFEQFLGEEP
jgi:hypothetical protein